MRAVAAKAAQTNLTIDFMADSDLWAAHPEAESIVRDAIAAAAAIESALGDIAMLLTDDATMRDLNAQWRGIDKPTNVLSFPSPDGATSQDGHLGDIAIAYEAVAREALAENKTFSAHLAHLAIHGYLHLLGFDHETDAEAGRMESLETRILAELAIADPYADRTPAD